MRRLVQALGVLLGASALVYVLVINAGDPLADLRESNARNRDYLIQQRIEFMNLDMPWWQRYFDWLGGIGRCFIGQCDFGTNRSGVDVGTLLGQAAASTLRLVFVATVLALIIGVAIGILTAIRQYSGLDYAVTFGTFLFFSLPVFWAAVLLKEYMAIGFNNWLSEPSFTPVQIVMIAVVLGVIAQVLLAGSVKRRLLTFGATAVFFGIALPTLTALDLFRNPQLGMLGVAVLTFGVALSVTAMTVGLKNREVLVPALIVAAVVSVAQVALFNVFAYYMNWWVLILGAVLAVALPWLLGRFTGNKYRTQAIVAATVTGFLGAGLTVVDHLFRAWPTFLDLKPRPISTIGSQTPNFSSGFWETFLDYGTQMLLPTLLLTIISLASYSRYTRASMLEVNRQDYIRTARAKGAPERTVIFRHALRNALIPIATIAAFDFAALIGGAVITERVFGWKGMGDLFAVGLDQVDPAPVMAFFLVTGGVAVLFNLIADISYAYLDPRIRV